MSVSPSKEYLAWIEDWQKRAAIRNAAIEAARPKRYALVNGGMVVDNAGQYFLYSDHVKLLEEAVANARRSGYDDGKSSNYNWRD